MPRSRSAPGSIRAPRASTSTAQKMDSGVDAPQIVVSQEVSVGAMARVARRDPGLVGGGNGGSGTSLNYDDGNLNYGRGLTLLGVQGRTLVDGRSSTRELRIEAVYFYDFINADGKTDFRPLSEAARDRAGRNLYLNDAYVGFDGMRLG